MGSLPFRPYLMKIDALLLNLLFLLVGCILQKRSKEFGMPDVIEIPEGFYEYYQDTFSSAYLFLRVERLSRVQSVFGSEGT